MKWATWENIGIDRMACAWLILRRIDSAAEFLFVAVGEAIPEGHEAFDIPGVRLSHRRGHCTFHTMLREYILEDPTLERIAAIIDEADIAQAITVEPVAAGLDTLCRGLRLICPDDHAAVNQGCLIYDALYAQISVELGGQS
jgi:hypothetical protein